MTIEPNEIILEEGIAPVTDEHPIPEDIKNLTEQEVIELIKQSDLNQVRTMRNMLIAETDWTQNNDVPEATKLKWQPYRQALRDITDQYQSMNGIVWPDKPV